MSNARKLLQAAQRGNVAKMQVPLQGVLRISGSGNWWGPHKILWTAYTAAVRNDWVDCVVEFAKWFHAAKLTVGCFILCTDGATRVCSAFDAAVLCGAFNTATALMQLFDSGRCIEAVAHLHSSSLSRSGLLVDTLGLLLLYTAPHATQCAAIRFLTQLKADVNTTLAINRSPLGIVVHLALRDAQYMDLRDARYKHGRRHFAKVFHTLQVLIQSRADVGRVNGGQDVDMKYDGRTLLHVLVLCHGQHNGYCNGHDKSTPYSAAADTFLLNAARLVIKAKVDPNAVDKRGQTAIDYAIEHQDDTILALLRT
jgi:hypothetical protein